MEKSELQKTVKAAQKGDDKDCGNDDCRVSSFGTAPQRNRIAEQTRHGRTIFRGTLRTIFNGV